MWFVGVGVAEGSFVGVWVLVGVLEGIGVLVISSLVAVGSSRIT